MSKYSDVRNIRVLSFLDAYERQRCLWDTSLDSYKNKADRDQAYLAIIRELNVPLLSVHDIKLKVKGVRTTYTKELRILNAHKKLGKPYKPKLFWFTKANSFLKNVCVSRRKKEFYPQDDTANQSDCKDFPIEYADDAYSAEEIIPENESNEDEQTRMSHDDDIKTYIQLVKEAEVQEYEELKQHTQDVEKTSTEPPQITDSPQPDHRNDVVNICQASPLPPSCKDDEFDLFCRSVAGQLRAIPDAYSRSMAKLKIQQILFEAETGHYKNSPCITIPIVQQINNI